jgi:hypothetical protein
LPTRVPAWQYPVSLAENQNVPTSRVRALSTTLTVAAGLAVLLSPLAQLAQAQDLTTVPIVDPAYGIKAFTITIPAGWKFEGTVLPGPECSQISFPVFRAYSPDGLSEIRLMPTFNWTFHPNTTNYHPTGCLEFGHTLTAAEFLKHYEEMIATSGMHAVGPAPIAPSYQRRVEGVGQNMNLICPDIHGSADAAAVRGRRRHVEEAVQRLHGHVAA